MHEAAFKELGLNWHYLTLPVHPKNLRPALKGICVLPFRGLNITIPFKEDIVKYLDKLEGDAKIISAANLVHVTNGSLIGNNCDASGIYNAIKAAIPVKLIKEVQNWPALIIGAGGAAKASALALRRLGISFLIILNRTYSRGKRFEKFCREKLEFTEVHLESININSINTSIKYNKNIAKIGIGISAVPKEIINLHLWKKIIEKSPDVICELAYGPKQTPLENLCKKHFKIRWVSGRMVLLHQGVLAFECWTGKKAPYNVMADALNVI